MLFAGIHSRILCAVQRPVGALSARTFSLFFALFMIVSHASAQTIANSTSANNESGLVTLNMRDADLRAVIQWIAEQTHKQIVIDPRVQGRVTAFADRPMTIAQAYQVFLSLLDVQGYSTSDVDGILRIYPSALAKISPRAVIDDFGKPEGSGQVVQVIAVKNVSNAAMSQLIKPLVSPTGYIAPLDSSDSLLIADSGDNVKRLVELVRRLDRSGSLEIDVIKLQHASAKDVAQVLSGLVKPANNNSGASEGSSSSSPISIAADERSNSILLAGEPISRQRAQQLIRQLDQPLSATNASRVVFLHYLSAEEMLPILKSVTNTAQKEAKEQAVSDSSISIEASKSNNAIVMTGPPDMLDNMQTILSKLDVQRSQVLVEALIVEVSNDVANDLGVMWQTTNIGDTKGSGGVAAVSTLGNLSAAAVDSTGAVTGPAAGLTLGYYTGGNLQAAIRALSSNSKVNVLSTPSVMTLDNQQAQIIVGSNIPIITGQSTGTASSTDNPFTTYQRQDIGVTLKITPQINADKSVMLDILQEVQTVADTANTSLAGANDIVTNKRSITTKVVVSNDKTLVLGGLISDQRQDSESKVPILGDMPLVGRLFRSNSHKMTKQNLMVFIHPIVIDSDAMGNKVSRENYDATRVQQMKYENGKLEPTVPMELPEFEKILPQRGATDDNAEPAK
ncbi:MAG: type secretion system protein GspD [Verrucomicrobiaceae bacterium]|nr:type secretion system protein GspD [Verrucomicrobiaceae bacterium]